MQENNCSHEYVDPKVVSTPNTNFFTSLQQWGRLFHGSNVSVSTRGISFKVVHFSCVTHIHFWTSNSSNLLFNPVNFSLHKVNTPQLFKSINCISSDPISISNGSMWISLLFVLRGFTMNAKVVLLILNSSNLFANSSIIFL